eukprot:232998-Rhodomonas_salina.2
MSYSTTSDQKVLLKTCIILYNVQYKPVTVRRSPPKLTVRHTAGLKVSNSLLIERFPDALQPERKRLPVCARASVLMPT